MCANMKKDEIQRFPKGLNPYISKKGDEFMKKFQENDNAVFRNVQGSEAETKGGNFMATSDIGSIPQQVKRAKAEGVQISECAIRRLIKEGKIPARYIGPIPPARRGILWGAFNAAFIEPGEIHASHTAAALKIF